MAKIKRLIFAFQNQTMKGRLSAFYKKSKVGFYLLSPFVWIYYFFLHEKYLPQEKFVLKRFKRSFGYDLDLESPKTLNEKINWMKLNYENPIGNKLADKYKVREYIKEQIGEQYLIPLVFVTAKPKEVHPKNFPDFPVIIKTNHNSSGGIVIKDKNSITDWPSLQNRLRANLSQNFYWDNREPVYKGIEPRIIVEKLLNDGTGKFPADYKVHCFNGKVQMISVDFGRGSSKHYRNWYSKNWEREPYKWCSVLPDGSLTDPSEEDIPRPDSLDEMIELSETLSKDFKYLRVDWYIINNKLFFGELTLYHNGGMRPVEPEIWDLKLGEKLSL